MTNLKDYQVKYKKGIYTEEIHEGNDFYYAYGDM